MATCDIDFIEQIQSYLRNFKRRSDRLFNFSCWYCGDSEKNRRKARGYLIQRKGSYQYYCHNCNKSTSLKNFLKDLDYNLYKEYLKETLQHKDDFQITADLLTKKPTKKQTGIFDSLPRINQLDNLHFARTFLTKRRIPNKWFTELRFTTEFRKFVNGLLPKKFENDRSEPRIIIPFFDTDGSCFGFQGRAIFKNDLRYYTIMLDEERHKVWGLHRVNFNDRFYVTEGPFDAMFMDNAIAICGSDILAGVHSLSRSDNAVLVYDNEPRNKAIIEQYQKAIVEGHKICIWPSEITKKDINDMILAGYTASELQHIIDENTFSGLKAQVRLNEWKKLNMK